MLPRRPGGELLTRGRYNAASKATQREWSVVEDLRQDWPWSRDGRYLLEHGLNGESELALHGHDRTRFVAFRYGASWHDRIVDALAQLRAGALLMKVPDRRYGSVRTAWLWLDDEYPTVEAKRVVAGFLCFMLGIPELSEKRGIEIPEVQPLPGCKDSVLLNWDDPTITPYRRPTRSNPSRFRTARREQITAILSAIPTLQIPLDRVQAFTDLQDPKKHKNLNLFSSIDLTPRSQTGTVYVRGVRRGTPGIPYGEGRDRGIERRDHDRRGDRDRSRSVGSRWFDRWEMIARHGVRAAHRWEDFLAFTFGYSVQHAGSTEDELRDAFDAWWADTRGGASRDAAADPRGTARHQVLRSRGRARQLRAALDSGAVLPVGTVGGLRALDEAEVAWVVERAVDLGHEAWVESLVAFAGHLYARPRFQSIHTRSVFIRYAKLAGRGARSRYKQFRAACEAVFVLSRVGGPQEGCWAQRYEVGIDLGAVDPVTDDAGRPVLDERLDWRRVACADGSAAPTPGVYRSRWVRSDGFERPVFWSELTGEYDEDREAANVAYYDEVAAMRRRKDVEDREEREVPVREREEVQEVLYRAASAADGGARVGGLLFSCSGRAYGSVQGELRRSHERDSEYPAGVARPEVPGSRRRAPETRMEGGADRPVRGVRRDGAGPASELHRLRLCVGVGVDAGGLGRELSHRRGGHTEDVA